MATTIVLTLNHVECWKCGVVFGLTPEYQDRRIRDHEGFTCPSGHWNYYSGESKEERLSRELREERDKLAREKHAREQESAKLRQRIAETYAEQKRVERSLRGTKAVVTRMKRRTVAGRCPCCSTQFKNLETHMRSKHPNWNPDRAAEALAEK